jgi:hypothetical protein
MARRSFFSVLMALVGLVKQKPKPPVEWAYIVLPGGLYRFTGKYYEQVIHFEDRFYDGVKGMKPIP